MNNPYFSIVVPTYNRADLIGKTIGSILQQEFNDFEVLVIDDGSRDNTEDRIKEFSDLRVHYFKKENGERGAARNYGREKARGRYVNFFDSDDRMYPNHLTTAKEAIEKFNEPEFFHLGYDYANPSWNIERYVEDLSESRIQNIKFDNILSCNGIFIRHDIAASFKFKEDRALASSEDWELWIRLLSRFKLNYSNTVTSSVVNHDQRSLRTIKTEKVIERDLFLIESLQQDENVTRLYGKGFGRFKAERFTFFMLYLAEDQKRAAVFSWAIRAVKAYAPIVFSRRFIAAIKNTLI